MNTTRQPLPDDCLLGGRVHPNIVERLERIRQLPVAGVANYLGLHEERGRVWLLWQQGDGRPFSEADPSLPARSSIVNQLRQVVEAMHSHGIVHGAIAPETIVIDSAGRVRLTHLSPLLYDDPAIDLAAIDRLFGDKPQPALDDDPINALRRSQRVTAAAIALAALLIFVGLLWYSQPR